MSVDGARSRTLLLVLVTLLVAAWAVAVPPSGGAAADRPRPGDPSQPPPDYLNIVVVDRNSTEQLWPYTSRRQSYDSATLPINVVVLKNAAYVRYLMTTTTGATWEVSESEIGEANTSSTGNATRGNGPSVESGVVLNGTRIEWTAARGSTRYTYIYNRTAGRGYWIDETYQLHDGTYLGSRYHLRLYEGGTGTDRWTAIQVHREHWDWFRLRHTVSSVDDAQDYVEREFFGMWFLNDIARVRFANAGALDADGWVSRIRLTDRSLTAPNPASISIVVGLFAFRRVVGSSRSGTIQTVRRWIGDRSIDPRYLPLSASLMLLPVVVRVAGITLERAFPTLSPKIIAAVLYLVIVIGVPCCAVVFSRRLRPHPSGTVSAVAFGIGMLLDYAYLDISVLPVNVVVHRTMLLVAVGVLAAGGSRSSPEDLPRNRLVALGIAIWIVGLAVPLLDLY